jgi:hypothetical protein
MAGRLQLREEGKHSCLISERFRRAWSGAASTAMIDALQILNHCSDGPPRLDESRSRRKDI